jgi:two-component system, NarL family, response regulator NreC
MTGEPRAGSEDDGAAGEGSPIRVVLADHHERMRQTLRSVLEADGDIEVAAEAADTAGARQEVDRVHPSVLVMDLRLRGGSALQAIRRLRERTPATQIVVVTMQEGAAYAERVLAAGALGFVLKDMADTDLAAAVRRADRGEPFESARPAW